jgi:hypothetical protein
MTLFCTAGGVFKETNRKRKASRHAVARMHICWMQNKHIFNRFALFIYP